MRETGSRWEKNYKIRMKNKRKLGEKLEPKNRWTRKTNNRAITARYERDQCKIGDIQRKIEKKLLQ